MTAAPVDAPSRLGPVVLRLAALLWWAYLWAVFAYQERVAGVPLGIVGAGIVLLIGIVALARVPVNRLLAPTRALEAGLAAVSLLAAVFVSDVAFTVNDNRRRAGAFSPLRESARLRDSYVLHGELYPRVYYPSDRNFVLFKPNAQVAADIYGQFYTPAMRQSRTLLDSVLQLRHVTYAIGPHGLREREPLAGARVFALGDSFTLGYGTDEGRIWPDVLGATLGIPVYNLGVSNTGPKAQLELLRYLLDARRDSLRIEHLMWMIYEGNDLEDSFARIRADVSPGVAAGLLEGTVLGLLASVPGHVKQQSVLRRLLSGELTLRAPTDAELPGARYEIDGVKLGLPLYHSSRWGWMLFNPQDIKSARLSQQDVLDHPNRLQLDSTFAEMGRLSRRERFRVTIILVPTAARLYGASFHGFPQVSAQPHFLDYVSTLGSKEGFAIVDLLGELRPFAERQMLYYRDDRHWNERGNAVAAQVLGAAVRGVPPKRD